MFEGIHTSRLRPATITRLVLFLSLSPSLPLSFSSSLSRSLPLLSLPLCLSPSLSIYLSLSLSHTFSPASLSPSFSASPFHSLFHSTNQWTRTTHKLDARAVQATGVDAEGALDLVITNALIIDPILGIIKADIGIKGNHIVGIGKAGNPDVMEGVTPGMVTGVTTECMAGEKLIATAGGVDTHVHWICPQIADEAIASGQCASPFPTSLTLSDTHARAHGLRLACMVSCLNQTLAEEHWLSTPPKRVRICLTDVCRRCAELTQASQLCTAAERGQRRARARPRAHPRRRTCR